MHFEDITTTNHVPILILLNKIKESHFGLYLNLGEGGYILILCACI